jgi:signal transduction histidine kinase
MDEQGNKKELLIKTFYKLVLAIYGQSEDPEGDLRSTMAENISGFGTGKHEIVNSLEDFIVGIFRVFYKQVPAAAKIEFANVESALFGNMGIVHSTSELNYLEDGVQNSYYVRRTIVFRWEETGWRAVHLHVSEPSAHLIEGESFPEKALKAQNAELKKQVEVQTEKLTSSLTELKATQQQLIESAKMSSLGELTAGIAHEIQNPLNFVNNFSELNAELIDELKTDLESGDTQKAVEVANDIKDNEEKINFHGKRADGIVKSMLMHSRASTGKKELTDINTLTDEYLRLAYHGLRAKDKSFNAVFETNFDPSIEKIKVVPQDIGRVLLNLFTNSFYSVTEKNKHQTEKYTPTVSVSTKKINGKVQISVRDNGMGIPQKVMDKIFQPFFTTKPTGQGTGLGLSLSYDIITKGHGGEVRLETKEGEFAEFIIQLPIQ